MASRELCETARNLLGEYQKQHRFRTRDWNGIGLSTLGFDHPDSGELGVTILLEKGPIEKAASQVQSVLGQTGLLDSVSVTYLISPRDF